MSDLPEVALPHAVALAWGVAESPQRGPKRELSIERIVESAIEIADSDGLGAVSMSRVATSLGYSTMSLYRYVTSKDDLLMLMQDAAAGFELPPTTSDDGWRAQLRQWTLANLEVLRAHPWYIEIPISGIPMTPNQLRAVDMGLKALDSTTLTHQEKIATILLVSGYARSVGGIEHDINAAGGGGDSSAASGAQYAAALDELVTTERFPYLRPVIVSGAYTGDDFDDFAFGLERLLDGVQHYLDTHERASAEGGAPDLGHSPDLAGVPDLIGRPPEFDSAREQSELYRKDKTVREIAKKRREAEKHVRELVKSEREALAKARERAEKQRAEKQH